MENDKLRLLGIKENKALVGPKRLEIEIINFCNINCLTCWFFSPLNPPFKDKPWKIKLPTFKGLIDEARKLSVQTICVPGIGEPTLHPQLGEMIIYAKKKLLPFHLATNLTFSSKTFQKQLLLCDNIDITFLAPNKKDYDRLQPSKDKSYFKTVARNIEYLATNKRIKNKPRINIMFIVNKLNYRLLEDMLKFTSKIGADSLELQPFDSSGNNKQLNLSSNEIDDFFQLKDGLGKKYPVLEEKFFNDYYSLKINKTDLKRCYMGYYTTLVAIRGWIKIGCFDPKSPSAGNIYRQKLSKIWYSKRAQEIRNSYIYNLKQMHKSNSHCPFLIRNKKLTAELKRIAK